MFLSPQGPRWSPTHNPPRCTLGEGTQADHKVMSTLAFIQDQLGGGAGWGQRPHHGREGAGSGVAGTPGQSDGKQRSRLAWRKGLLTMVV